MSKVILRILVSPFIFPLYFIYAIRVWVISCIDFIKYGGEVIQYKKEDKATIAAIYDSLKNAIMEENSN
jgi:hypothetical protein